MKEAAMILTVLFSVSVGLYFSARLRKRFSQWEEICRDFRTVGTEIMQHKIPLGDAIRNADCRSSLFQTLSTTKNEDVLMSYRRWRTLEKQKNCLQNEDYQLLESFFSEVGKYGSEEQNVLCKEFDMKAKERLAETEEKYRKYGKLWTVGCLAAGLFAVIVMW